MSESEELILLKEWLRIDSDAEDATLLSLLLSSKFVIKQATGVVAEDILDNEEALELYRLIQRMLITDLYENRTGSQNISPLIVSLCTQLKMVKLQDGGII